MKKIRIGYDSARVVPVANSDGSLSFNVVVEGFVTLTMRCVDEQAAKNLALVWEHGVIDLEVE